MKILVQIAVALGAMVVIALVQPPPAQQRAAVKPIKTATPNGRP
jgi:hypothetical protein